MTNGIIKLLQVKLTMTLILTWISSTAKEALRDRMQRSDEAELLLPDVVIVATELRHRNGVVVLMERGHYVMPADFVST